MTSAVPHYNPTPLEYAYTSYLLETVFDLDASVSEIKISGREAVTFLSKSGVHRLILRNIWTTVDPNSAGSLLHRRQLSTLLRCVALAQHPKNDSLLDHALRAAYHDQKSPVVAIGECLVATSGQKDVPLASFDGIPLPDRATLQPYLNDATEEDEEETETDDFGDFSAAPTPAATAAAAPFPPSNQTTIPVSQQQQTGLGGFDTFSSNNSSMGGGNAMPQSMGMSQVGGLMPSQRQQQSSMPTMAVPPMQQQSLNNNTQSWGDFDNMVPVPQQVQNQQHQDEFGGFVAASSTLPSMQQSAHSGWDAVDARTPPTVSVAPIGQDQPMNGFGELSSSVQPPAAQSSGWNAPSGSTTGPTPINPSLNPPSGMTLPNAHMGGDVAQTMNDNFGGFISFASRQAAPEPSGWDALDALATSTPAPPPPTLPSVESSSQPPEVSSGQVATINDDDDDDFGDFAAAQTNQQPVPQQQTPGERGSMDTSSVNPNVPTTITPQGSTKTPQISGKTHDFGGFASSQLQMQQSTQSLSQEPSGWDALDALAALAPAPPPVLPDASVSTDQQMVETTEESQTKDDVNDLAGFASTSQEEQKPQSSVSGWDALDALASPSTVPALSLPDPSNVTLEISGGTPAGIVTNDDSDFGDFTSSDRSGTLPITENGAGATTSGWVAQDSLTPGMNGSSNQQQQQPDELTAATSGVDDTTAASSPVNVLDNMTESPLQFENEQMSPTASERIHQLEHVASSGWDALDALATPPAPPPPSGNHQPGASEIVQLSKDTEEFGDFGSKSVEPKPGPDVNNDDDEFGDFESTPAPLTTTEPNPSSAWGAFEALAGSAPLDGPAISTQAADEPIQNPPLSQQDPLNVPRSVGLGRERAVSLSPPPEERSGIPDIPNRKAIGVVRSDTAFYSAKTSSFGVQSEVSSLDDFTDAIQNPEDPTGNEQMGMNGAKPAITTGGLSPQEVDSDDPFAAFQNLAPEQPEQPLPPLSSFERKDSTLDAPAESYEIVNEQTQHDIKAATPLDPTEQLPKTGTNMFGDFAGAQPNKPTHTVTGSVDLFDAFASPVPTADANDDFGDFSAPSQVPVPASD
eukprot:scaffold2093_cov161-Amphora_coffeaeformis.AAC.18